MLFGGEVVAHVPDEVARRGIVNALVVGDTREGTRGVDADMRALLSGGGLDVDNGWRRRGSELSLQRGGLSRKLPDTAVLHEIGGGRELVRGRLTGVHTSVILNYPPCDTIRSCHSVEKKVVVHVVRETVVVLVILVEVEASLRNTGGIVGWVDERHDLEFGREILGVRSGCDRCGCEWRRQRFT